MQRDDSNPAYDELEFKSDATVKELLEDGLFRFGAGDTQGAVDSWQRVLALEPGNSDAVDYLRSAGVSPIVRSPKPHLQLAPEQLVAEKTDDYPRMDENSAPAPSNTTPKANSPSVTASENRRPPSTPSQSAPEPRHSIHRSQPMPVITGELIEQARPSTIIALPPPEKKDRRLMFALIGVGVLLAAALVAFMIPSGSSADAENNTNLGATGGNTANSGLVGDEGDNDDDNDDENNTTFLLDVDVSPREASLILDGRVIGTGSTKLSLPKDGSKHTLIVRADGYAEQHIAFMDVAPAKEITLAPLSMTRSKPVKRVSRSKRGKRGKQPSTSSSRSAEPSSQASKSERPTTSAPAKNTTTTKESPTRSTRATDIKNPWNK